MEYVRPDLAGRAVLLEIGAKLGVLDRPHRLLAGERDAEPRGVREAARLSQFAYCSSRQRLELALRGLMPSAAGSARDVKLQTPLKHREIAELIAVTPEQLSRLLKEMEQEGRLRREKGWLILRDIRTWSRARTSSPVGRPPALRTEWLPGRLIAVRRPLTALNDPAPRGAYVSGRRAA